MLVRQVVQFGKQIFLLSDLSLQELFYPRCGCNTASPGLNASSRCVLECHCLG